MMAINILVIDDDRKMAERLMRGLQRADKENILGEIQVDDSVIKLETVENYDISHFETTFDVALIDYQLSSSFTGILVSAWIALYLQIPRLTLTTASYPGNPAYFNGSILKNEITDSPEVVIQRILECVENYNAELWLAKQHQELVAEYQHMLKKRERAVNRLNELEMQKQDFLSKEAPCNESTTDLHTGMLKTMYEMVTTLAEQTVLMIDEEIHKLNILMEKHSGSDEE